MLPVMVGTDGSESSLAAVGWAAREARQRGVPLRILAVGPDGVTNPTGRQMSRHDFLVRRQLEDQLETARAHAREQAPGVDARIEVRVGPPAAVLAEETARHLVVVGARGLGGWSGLVAGSVSRQVATQAPGPVVVVRQAPLEPLGRIVVGVDDAEHSVAALEFGYLEAALHGAELRVLHAGAGGGLPESLSARIEAAGAARPGVRVHTSVTSGDVPAALAEASRDADLTVVGSRGRNRLSGLLVGSVGQGLLSLAHGPVAIARDPRD
ncbi:universal stress protein [Marinitenerispora sediminis]|uniref:Universal stress protein n=1 Tax=Marinitenerispora sediminis TaxID=1931232 RepID=A0A368T3B7_9ACTN|nr:universal stress protein [Marinitenerispora sediminis]RCV54093.1 universal stress protein [Marinitenerispora sediminis]RCV56816.1 universal stress protein [Marinitenerispora sediminis]RCV56939.1 universal stress protein [Marinitenerispora sediminis]